MSGCAPEEVSDASSFEAREDRLRFATYRRLAWESAG